jgi:hypothetical protein
MFLGGRTMLSVKRCLEFLSQNGSDRTMGSTLRCLDFVYFEKLQFFLVAEFVDIERALKNILNWSDFFQGHCQPVAFVGSTLLANITQNSRIPHSNTAKPSQMALQIGSNPRATIACSTWHPIPTNSVRHVRCSVTIEWGRSLLLPHQHASRKMSTLSACSSRGEARSPLLFAG